MKKIKTLRSVQAENDNIYNASLNGAPLTVQGTISQTEVENLGNIQIHQGVLNLAGLTNRIKDAKELEEKIKTKLGNKGSITVEPDLDNTSELLEPIKQMMKSLGIDKLSDLEVMTLNQPLRKLKKGEHLIAAKKKKQAPLDWKKLAKDFTIMNPTHKKEQLALHLPNLNSSSVKIATLGGNVLQALPVLSGTPEPVMMKQLPVGTSVIIASELDLTNTTLEIHPDIDTLLIIADKIKCGKNALITWKRPGGETPARQDDADLNGRGYSGVQPGIHHGLNGENGSAGSDGINGATGRPAPSLELWVKDLSKVPNIDLNGEPGIKGGTGQCGGHGGDAGDGAPGQYRKVLKKCHSKYPAGDGGYGGNGGRGGEGGRGGNGGAAGSIIIGVLDGTLEKTITQSSFKVKNQGGEQGRGGNGGKGGNGGDAGRSGNGQYCKNGRDGVKGATGQPGTVGADGKYAGKDADISFFQFTEDAWDEMLTRPYITEIQPAYVFPGYKFTISGTKFVKNDKVVVEGVGTLKPVVNADESLTVTIPAKTGGGVYSVYVQRASDKTESNRFSVRVKPLLDVVPALMTPGAELTVTGKAFLPGASVLINGNAVPSVKVTTTGITFKMPGVVANGVAGGTRSVQVRNPDGLVSNIRFAEVAGVLGIPFKYGTHNFAFVNPNDGVPSWSGYEKTFGKTEVRFGLAMKHPVLTLAYYIFYQKYLKGTAKGGYATGFCTAMSSLVADKFWKGETDGFKTTKAMIHPELTSVHGRLLSRESLIHFHDQSREGIARIERTTREIETVFLKGCDRYQAPLLFFIPAGAVWDAGYIDAVSSTHCIMPYRFEYPKGHKGPKLNADDTSTISDLDGVKLYCWDCNFPTKSNCWLEFSKKNGVLHFDYHVEGEGIRTSSSNNITLGHISNGKYLLSDHDLPFSGAFGLTEFIIDFLLSPADMQILDENGKKLGNFNNKIYSDVPGSHACYLLPGAYMLPVGKSYTRKIVGNGNGVYTFNSIMPDGTTIKLENVQTKPGHQDTLIMNTDASQVRFVPQVEKAFTLTFSRLVGEQVRSLSISGIGSGPGKECDITVGPDLSLFRLGNKSALKNVEVSAFSMHTTNNTPVNKQLALKLPTNHDLVVSVTDWDSLDLQAEALAF